MTAWGPGLMSFSGTLRSTAVRWLGHYQLPVQSRRTHRGVLTGRAPSRPWDGMAVGLGAQARALPRIRPCNMVGFLGNGRRLPPQTFLCFCLSVCGLPSFRGPCDFGFSFSQAHPWNCIGSMRKGLSLVPLSSSPSRAWLPRMNSFLNGGRMAQGWAGSVFRHWSSLEVSWTPGRHHLWSS